MRSIGWFSFGLAAASLCTTTVQAQEPFDAHRMMMEQAASTRQADEAAKAKRKVEAAKAAAKHPCKVKGGVAVGMTRAQVYASCWGKPTKINITTTGSGDHEQLVYPGYQYVYLHNGIVTSIQTSR